ncbi:hypothetical protein Ddye_022863 [Dipteronia dyeriana]|uniref:Uncharacterized protein n=1 Tax=Dipteronia dyeriana TaxID=168575 RepID=A0AAD9WSU7_9ROSI|nr:hypothetical protein Ddye_022863 [Dipteronia dyeriana]
MSYVSMVGLTLKVLKVLKEKVEEGVKVSRDMVYMTIEVHDKIITTEAICNSSVLFKQSIKGPWVTYTEYPKEELDTLYARFKSNFNYTCSEEVLRAAFNEHVRIRYPEWMSSIRQSVFKEFKTIAERYTNYPYHILVAAWSTMVDTWLSKKWKKVSETKKNRDTKDIVVHTPGSVPMAKYRKEEDNIIEDSNAHIERELDSSV